MTSIPLLARSPLIPDVRMPLLTGLPSGMTFTRASTGTYFGSDGYVHTAANNEPRFEFHPVTLQPRGLLIEESKTNSVRNSTMQGASVPSTLPSGWVYGGLSGLTRNVICVGTEYGLPYIDIQFVGTPTVGGPAYILFSASTVIPANVGQMWTASFYARIVNGSTANVSNLLIGIDEASSVGGYLDTENAGILSTINSSLQRFSLSSRPWSGRQMPHFGHAHSICSR